MSDHRGRGLNMRGSRYFSMRSRIVAMSAVVGVCSVYGAQTVLAAPSADQAGLVRLIVQTKSGLTMADQHGVVARSGGSLVRDVHGVRAHVVDVPAGRAAAMLKQYQSDPSVAHAEIDQPRHISGAASDPSYADQWALPQVGWDNVHGAVTPSGSSTIAVLDTGIDGANPDLTDELVPGWSAFGNNPTADPNGHGTWVASIAAAATDNDSGIAGVAYAGAHVMPVQVIGADGTGQDSDIISGVTWAADNGADVILMAFSNPGFSQALQDAVNYAWSKGAVVVAAVDNDGSTTATYPAGETKVVGVAATDAADSLAPSSNYGPSAFLAAPGVNIAADTTDGGVTSVTGTSGAAAIVAGAASLLRANDPAASNGAIVGRLARNADPAGTPEQTGNGRVNLSRAISDSSTVEVVPGGAASNGAGGPLVGPYTVASSGQKSTQLTLPGATGTYGGTTTLSARLALSSGGGSTPIANETIDFTVGGKSAGSAITDANGLATLSAVSLAGINVGSSGSGVRA